MNAAEGELNSPLKIGDSLRHPHVVRLALAGAILGASIVILCLYASPGVVWRNPVAHSLLEMCGVLIISGIVYCLWVQYCVSTERRTLLAMIAFAGLMVGQFVHSLTSACTPDTSAPYKWGFEYYEAWRIAAALILIASARTSFLESKPTSRRTGLRALGGSIAISFVVAGIVIFVSRSWDAILGSQPAVYAYLLRYAGRVVSSTIVVNVVSLAAVASALVVFAHRYAEHEDAFSDGMSRCLLLAAGGQAAWLMSVAVFDLSWWVSNVLVVVAMLELLIGLAIEFGASYADAQARVEHLEAVHHISSRLSNTLDLTVVLLVLVSDIAGMLEAKFASVMLADDAGETLRTVATHGLPESPWKSGEPQQVEGGGRPGFYAGHASRAFKEKKVCVVEDVHADVEFVPWRLLAMHNGYAVSVPLVYQEVALGVLNLFFDKHIPMNGERIRLFETLASAAAVAIANAQLYDKTVSAESEVETFSFRRLRLAS